MKKITRGGKIRMPEHRVNNGLSGVSWAAGWAAAGATSGVLVTCVGFIRAYHRDGSPLIVRI